MAESQVTKTKRNGRYKFRDALGREYECDIEDGNFSFSAETASRVVVRDRGVIVGARKGDDPVLTASFDVDMRQFTDATQDTIVDVIEFTGAWAGAQTTGGTAFEFPTLTGEFTVDGIAVQDAADHVLTMYKVFSVWDFKEGDLNKITVKQEIYGGYARSGPA